MSDDDPVCGYVACWIDHGNGKPCRMPKGHAHRIEIARGEFTYQAKCSCGWSGQARPVRWVAAGEAFNHNRHPRDEFVT